MTNEISENQFWQLFGLITAARELRKKMDSLGEAYAEITNEEDKINRFSDYVWNDNDLISELKKHLPHDGISVNWKTKEKERQP